MPANKHVYNDAIKKASNAAWDRQWNTAIREYRRALAEFPEDSSAHSGLALAFQEANQLDEALHEYRLTAKLQPLDPVPLARTAALLEKLGKRGEALATYLALADMFTHLKQMNKAVEAWRRAAALEPERVDIHEKLAAAFIEAGHNGAASKEWTALAKIAQRAGDLPRARECVERALALDSADAPARALMAELTGRNVARAAQPGASPVEQARKSALSRLAATVFDDRPQWRRAAAETPKAVGADVETLLARAIDAQTRGQTLVAIDAYEQLIAAGVTRPEVQFNLALLCQSTLQYDAAIALLKETVEDPQYALASNFALGQSYRAQGRLDQALEHFIQAMKIVDLANVRHEQADEVIRLYQSLADSYQAKGDTARAESFTQTLVDFLTSKGWEDKLRDVRRHIEAVRETGTPLGLAEVMQVPDSAQVIEELMLSEQYRKQGKLYAAGDLAYQALERAPDYLPAHVQLAEIQMQAGRMQDAQEKFQVLAETAVARGDVPKAISFYRRALKLMPEDVTRRAKLIDLLVRDGQLPEALSQFEMLGEALERVGQTQKAIDKYEEGLRLAQRAGVVGETVSGLRTRLAEAYLKVQDWARALNAFAEIAKDNPDNERTRFILADLYMHVGRAADAEREFEALLSLTDSSRQPRGANRVRAVLTAFANDWPDEVWVNLRLVRAMVAAGESKEAVALLDGLGERLQQAERSAEAVQVIEEIIALDPPQADGYRKLLNELKNNFGRPR